MLVLSRDRCACLARGGTSSHSGMMVLMMTITWRVAELAEQRGWGARPLVKAAKLGEQTVRNILAGRATRVDLETVARLSATLEVTPGALWTSQPDPAQAWVS